MIRSLWIAKTGLDAATDALDVIFQQSRQRQHIGPSSAPARCSRTCSIRRSASLERSRRNRRSLPTGLQIGVGVRPVATERVFTQGNLQQTGNSLDVGSTAGFLQVSAAGRNHGYTRDGTLHLDNQGQVVTSSGYNDDAGDHHSLDGPVDHHRRDGTISITQPGSPTPTQVGAIQLANFVNPPAAGARRESLRRDRVIGVAVDQRSGQQWRGNDQSRLHRDVERHQRGRELGHDQTQRAYEINSKAVQTSDQMLQRLSQM